MWPRKLSVVALVSVLLVCVAGCATTRGDLESGANQLERAAHKLALDTRDVASATGYQAAHVRDAQALAQETHVFRKAADDRAARNQDLRSAFERVSRNYRVVHEEVDHSDNLQIRADFGAVTDAYALTEHDIGGYTIREARAF